MIRLMKGEAGCTEYLAAQVAGFRVGLADHNSTIAALLLRHAFLRERPDWASLRTSLACPAGPMNKPVRFLMTGLAYNDLPAREPPTFRFNREDAGAIVAYLRSLAPAQK